MIDNSASPDPHPTQIGINGSLAGETDSETFGSGEEQRWWHFLLSEGRTRQSFAVSMKRRDSGIAKQNVTHLVTWQRNVSTCRLDGAE